MTSIALTIAGSDPSGGAGLQADLKTFHQHGVYGMSVVTLLTVQNTRTVTAIKVIDAGFVTAQLHAVLDDIPPGAAKTGALGSTAVIEAVARQAEAFDFPLVVDPVMISKHGQTLIDDDAVGMLRDRLLPRAFLVTPNIHEAASLTGMKINDPAGMERAAQRIAALGPQHVLVKGGALSGRATDVLLSHGEFHRFSESHIDSMQTHGSGCVFSAAITARLARGETLLQAVAGAKQFVTEAIRTAPRLGRGVGPTNMSAAESKGSGVFSAD